MLIQLKQLRKLIITRLNIQNLAMKMKKIGKEVEIIPYVYEKIVVNELEITESEIAKSILVITIEKDMLEVVKITPKDMYSQLPKTVEVYSVIISLFIYREIFKITEAKSIDLNLVLYQYI